MSRLDLLFVAPLLMLLMSTGCTKERRFLPDPDGSIVRMDGGLDASIFDAGAVDGAPTDGALADAETLLDADPLSPDAACVSRSITRELPRTPVDIIWVVDNSASMESATTEVQAGLNAFAELISARRLDYRVIVVSLRGRGELLVRGKSRFQICIPPPLSGDSECGDGERFFQVETDVKSIQPLEQILGTLGQTNGYLETSERGSAPWVHLLRPGAIKTFVIVSDDNSRLTPHDFEHFAGGNSPFGSRELPPGILEPHWEGLFDGYVFSGIFGWGHETDPDIRCMFPDGSFPETSGATYSALVEATGGVRAQICAGADAWGPFFERIASTVADSSPVACEIPLPEPPEGLFLVPNLINVSITSADGAIGLRKVNSFADCDERGGWAYDDEANPSGVLLCPTSCEAAQPDPGEDGGLEVLFGCDTIPI